ncbi:MAG: dinB [Ilumatobacteraceae bacterium]|nr:dinB [Ilumatobacteraceae bacterium]
MTGHGPDAPGDIQLGTDGGRAILHIDMDAFFVAVELRRRPELRGKPVVVGGSGRRGVVAAASYEARRYGVFSAMPSVTARRRCPNAVFLSGDHDLYAQVSRQVHQIFRSVTPHVEPVALDEAFLDVTGSIRLFGSARAIAEQVRLRIATELELACSVGGGTSKFIAKLASKAAKPRIVDGFVRPGHGIWLVPPGGELEFLHPLPVAALWGVGPATLARLQRFGVRTVGDLAAIDLPTLTSAVGASHGRHLHDLSWARDDREVESDRETKSIGHEETFTHDRHTQDELMREAVRLADAVSSRLRAAGTGARTVSLKLRFADFETITRSSTVAAPIVTTKAIVDAVQTMLSKIDVSAGVRLLGVSVSGFGEPAEQLSMDDLMTAGSTDRPVAADWVAASSTIDAIRERFGSTSIGPASAMSTDGLRLVRPGAQQWGPDQQPAPRSD